MHDTHTHTHMEAQAWSYARTCTHMGKQTEHTIGDHIWATPYRNSSQTEIRLGMKFSFVYVSLSVFVHVGVRLFVCVGLIGLSIILLT